MEKKRKGAKAMKSKKFQRTKEDFVCGNCGFSVRGNGYTNHCPQCLWSKHVDVNPGDRQETCHGLMKPIAIDLKKGEYSILHHCEKCGFERWNKVSKDDDFDIVVKLSNRSLKS